MASRTIRPETAQHRRAWAAHAGEELMIDRKHRAAASDAAQRSGAIATRLDGADPDELVALIARANAALPDSDSRKIRLDEVTMLRRLASQAQTIDSSMVARAAERRLAGERRGRVSPEASNTAEWAARLAVALEAIVEAPQVTASPVAAEQPHIPRRSASPKGPPNGGGDEYLAHQTREFHAADGSAWRVRIEQGGGKPAADSRDPPVAALIFRPATDDAAAELAAAEPGGKWDLSSYSDAELQAVLDRARAARRARE
jgi:hypothetical protein